MHGATYMIWFLRRMCHAARTSSIATLLTSSKIKKHKNRLTAHLFAYGNHEEEKDDLRNHSDTAQFYKSDFCLPYHLSSIFDMNASTLRLHTSKLDHQAGDLLMPTSRMEGIGRCFLEALKTPVRHKWGRTSMGKVDRRIASPRRQIQTSMWSASNIFEARHERCYYNNRYKSHR